VRQVNLKRMPVNRKLIGWVFVVTGLVSGWLWWREQKPQLEPLKISYQIERKEEEEKPVARIRSRLNSAQGDWAVAVYRLDEKKGYGVNEETVLPAASIMKVPIMMAVFRKIEAGSLKLEDVEEDLRATGKRSDNDAPATLVQMVGRDFVKQTIAQLEMAHTDFDANTTTAYDVVMMWRKIYEEKNQQLLDLLQDSIYEDRIPPGLPVGISFVHKVGTDLDIWSDAGIVMAEKPFVLVIMNEKVDMDEAKKLVPELTALIWDYEAGRNAKPQ